MAAEFDLQYKPNCTINGLPYTREEALSYAKELARVTNVPIDIDMMMNSTTEQICQEIERLEDQEMKCLIQGKDYSKKQLLDLLHTYVKDFEGDPEYLARARYMSKENLCKEITEAEIYDQTINCIIAHQKYTKAQLLAIATQMDLPGNNSKKSKKQLCEDITKRYIEALKIVNLFDKKN